MLREASTRGLLHPAYAAPRGYTFAMIRKANIYDRDLERNAANYAPLTPLSFLERGLQTIVFAPSPTMMAFSGIHGVMSRNAR